MSHYHYFDPTDSINILRVACGLFLLPHLYAKALNLPFAYKLYAVDTIRRAPASACIAIDTICSIGMVLAIETRYAAALGAVFLAVAAWAVWRYSNGKWLWNVGGMEYCTFWAICCVAVAMHG